MSGEENTTTNPYEAYYHALMDLQKEMASAYFKAQESGEWAPNMPPPPLATEMPPFMAPSFYPPPHGMHPHFGMMQQPPPMMQTPASPTGMQEQMATSPVPEQQETNTIDENNPLYQQAQAMLDNALGEEAEQFKEILGSFGMNDKEFWKGAMVGAAAALLLSNENVRGKLFGLVSGAGDMLKTGGGAVKDGAVNTASAVKDTAVSTASNVKENVATGGEIFKDTVAAGKQGFHASVEKHKGESESVVAEIEEVKEASKLEEVSAAMPKES